MVDKVPDGGHCEDGDDAEQEEDVVDGQGDQQGGDLSLHRTVGQDGDR